MQDIRRYAIYYAPPPGDFARAAADWLGRDLAAGAPVAQPAVPGLDLAAITADPRRYGFHGTLKPPFRLAAGRVADELAEALGAFAAPLPPLEFPGLRLARIGGFLALVPEGETATLAMLAARVVTEFEPFRAPLSAEDRARRHPETLSRRQVELLDTFGYPFVLEEFRFHLTLSDKIADPVQAEALATAAEAHFVPHLPRPFRVDALCLCGEDAAGRFRLLSRHPLRG